MRHFFCILGMLASLMGCESMQSRRELKEFMSRRIEFPPRLLVLENGRVNSEPIGLDKPLLVVYVDSTECSLCRVKSLGDYENLNREALEKNAFKLLVVFSPRIADQPELIDYLILFGPDFQIYIDDQRRFAELNSFPESYAFHTFLVDGEGFPILVGDPVYDKCARKKFVRMLVKSAI